VLGYKCENFRASNSGIQAIKTYGEFVFVNRGDRLEKREILTGNLLTTIPIPGGSFIVTTIPFFGTTTALGNSGIDIDTCGNIYVGSTNGVIKFDQSLSVVGNYPTTFKVYDVSVSTDGNVIACGSTADDGANVRSGSVQSFAAAACIPPLPQCCNAAICEVPELCNEDAPFQLTTVGSGGTWTGTGVSATGLFNPANVGEGTFEVTYQLACGSETVSITVNNCSAMSVCEETDGTYTVEGGTGPYSWEYYTAPQTIQITNQAQCEACGYQWLLFGCFSTFPIPAEACTGPESWTEYASGTNAPAPTIFPSRVTNSAGTEYIINSGDEIVPCAECPADTVDLTISACESYTNPLGGQLTQSGIYSYTLQSSADCDSIIRLDLTINTPTSSTTSLNICSGQLPYTWNGITFTAAGVQSTTLQSAAGCDSVATLNLIVAEELTSTTNLTVCEAQIPYVWNGITFSGPGTQSANLFTEAGCDSVATLILDVAQQLTSNTELAICDVQLPYTWNGITFTQSSTQSITLTSTAGCDSVATLNLSVNSFVPFTDVQAACESFTWIDGNTYTSSTNTPVFTITGGSAAGCDSIITLNLTLNQNAVGQNAITSCGPYTNEVGQVFEQSTSYNFVLPTSEGCDSVVTVSITVLPLPEVIATASSTSIFVGDSVLLDANGAVFYVWSPEADLSCTNCESPIATPRATAT
jgi:hypothetical protein